MKKFTDFITEKKSHLHNLYIQVDEELRKVISTDHSRQRKDQTHNQVEDVLLKETIEIIEKCDDQLTNDLLNRTDKTVVGIKKYLKSPLKYFIVIFEAINFNKETFEYDAVLITHDKYGDDKPDFIFKPNTDIIYEIKNNYVKKVK